MVDMIPFATAQVDGILAYAGNLFTDLSLLIILIIGLPLGFWVISRVISLVRAR